MPKQTALSTDTMLRMIAGSAVSKQGPHSVTKGTEATVAYSVIVGWGGCSVLVNVEGRAGGGWGG